MRGDKKGLPSRSGLPACLAAGAAIAAAVCALNVSRDYGWIRSVCDGLFVASVMLLGAGGIRAVGNRGAFDVAGYGLRTVLELVLPLLRLTDKGHSGETGEHSAEDIHQYRARREAQRRSPAGLLLAGGVYFILSLAALVVYEVF